MKNKLSKHVAPTSKIKQLSKRELAQAYGGDANTNPTASTITQQYVKN